MSFTKNTRGVCCGYTGTVIGRGFLDGLWLFKFDNEELGILPYLESSITILDENGTKLSRAIDRAIDSFNAERVIALNGRKYDRVVEILVEFASDLED